MTTKDLFEIKHFYPATRDTFKGKVANNVFRTFKTRWVDATTFRKFEEFREQNPDFNFYFFDDLDMEEYMFNHWRDRKIYQVFKDLKFGASKADVWRYCVLWHFGGVYLDFDSAIRFPLASIPETVDEIVGFEGNSLDNILSESYTPNLGFFADHRAHIRPKLLHPNNIILQWLMIFRKDHPVLINTIELIEKYSPFFNDKEFPSVLRAVCNFTGPVMFTRAVWEFLSGGNNVAQAGIDFDLLAVFKDFSDGGTYASDENYYVRHTNKKIIDTKQVRLNLGCGDDIRPCFTNIDAISDNPEVVKLDLSYIQSRFNYRTVDEIFARDVIEHVGLPTAIRWVSEWERLLKDGGVLFLQTTCFDLIASAFARGKITGEHLNYLLFAGVSWNNGIGSWDTELTSAYDWHRLCFTKDQLFTLLEKHNFVILSWRLDSLDDIESGVVAHGLNISVLAVKRNNRVTHV